MLYTIERQSGRYVVLTISGRVVQYSSSHKSWCIDWIADQRENQRDEKE